MTAKPTRRRTRRVDAIGTIVVKPHLYAAIKELASGEDRSAAAMARLLIREALARRGMTRDFRGFAAQLIARGAHAA
jgi:hypothetical protein